LDLNSNDLLNVGTTNTQTLYINGVEVEPNTGVSAGSAFQTYSFTATAGQTTFSVSPATPLVSSLLVSVNGLELPPADISVSTTNVILPACTLNDEVVIRRFTKEPTIYPTAATLDFLQAGTGAVTRTAQAKMRDLAGATDFGAIADGVTDNTSAILAAATTSGLKFLIVPYGVKYDRASLLAQASFPDDVVLLDFSGINDFSSAGETTKHFGIVSKDSAPDDTHWSIDSGHHPIVALNNYGTAGSTSASERKATLIWNAGQFANGATQNKGFRGAALLQFTKEATSNYWIFQLRSLAPWTSIANQYEEWRTGEVISSTSTYRLSNGQQYVSASTGTTGGTAPSHTSGTVSDGGVSWAWVDSGDRSVFNVRQDGRVLYGQGDYGATWRHKVSIVDPAAYIFQGVSTGVSKSANLQLIPTDSGGNESVQPYLRAEHGDGLRVMKSDSSTDIGSWTNDGGYLAREFRTTWGNAANADTTPSVSGGITTLWISNTGATNITALDEGNDGQIVHLVFANANTTLVSSATLMMQGSVNVTPTQFSVITMMKVPVAISDRWIEVARSIK
jgi:hypothetical protein